MIQSIFPENYVWYADGPGEVLIPQMMQGFRFDHVFYTGSTHIGKKIYQMAAEQLVPVTLELGGKSPCVIESDANLEVAARRIALARFSNAGQMCVAPDYLLIHASIAPKFTEILKAAIIKMYSQDAQQCYHYGKIINSRQYDRLVNYLQDGEIILGGKTNAAQLYIEPTLMTHIKEGAQIMEDEIFGPILPIFTFNTMEDALAKINRHPDPLAFYIFTGSGEKEREWIKRVPFGGGCVNNCSWHLTNHQLPFGGRGNSGIGKYHGRFSFDTFSHHKAIMRTPTWFDPAMKYPPLKGKMGLFKFFIR
jgi:aldehyde dehydrogenase (NAD+)